MRIMYYTSRRIVAGRALQKSEDCGGKRKAENREGKKPRKKREKEKKEERKKSQSSRLCQANNERLCTVFRTTRRHRRFQPFPPSVLLSHSPPPFHPSSKSSVAASARILRLLSIPHVHPPRTRSFLKAESRTDVISSTVQT